MSTYSVGLMMFLGAAALAGALTPMVIELAKRLGALDRPAHRKATSRRVVPTLGGVAIFLGFVGAIGAAALLVPEVRSALFVESHLGYVVGAVGGLMALMGVVDDRVSLRPRTKLAIQTALALGVIMYGLSFERLTIPWLGTLELQQLAIPLTLLWFVGVTNALNLVDGIDGLASGVALVVALTVAVIGLMTGNLAAVVVAAALAGACAGFLPYNFSPARIFLGDSGSLFLGATLAVLSLASSTKAAVAGSMLIPVLLLGYPTLDTLLVMGRRMLKGKPIFAGGRDHIHHRLLARGLSHGQSSLALYGFCAIFCLIAIGATTPYDQAAMVGGLVVVILVMILGSVHLGYFSEMTPEGLRHRRFEFLAVRYRFLVARAEMELAPTPESVLGSVRRIGRDFGVRRIRLQMRDRGRTLRWRIEMGRASDRPETVDRAIRMHSGMVASRYGANGHGHSNGNGNGDGNGNGRIHGNGNGHAHGNGHGNGSRAGDAHGMDGGGFESRANGGGRLTASVGEEKAGDGGVNGAGPGDADRAGSAAEAEPMIYEKLRFPESRMTARVEMTTHGVHPDLKLEHRIYLSNALQVAGRRLAALAEAEAEAEIAAETGDGLEELS